MIKRIKTRREFSEYSDELSAMHRNCFKEHPWLECYTAKQSKNLLKSIVCSDNNITLVSTDKNMLNGALFSRPVSFQPEIYKFMPTEPYLYRDKVLYIETLFVPQKLRRQGNTKSLLRQCVKIAKDIGFKYAVLRASEEVIMFDYFQQKGFYPKAWVGVPTRKKFGTRVLLYPDNRVIMLKKL